MSDVRYAAESHHKLIAFGRTVHGGDPVDFTETELRSLVKQGVKFDGFPVTPERPELPSKHGSRRQWAKYAEDQGINTTAGMSREEIIAKVTS